MRDQSIIIHLAEQIQAIRLGSGRRRFPPNHMAVSGYRGNHGLIRRMTGRVLVVVSIFAVQNLYRGNFDRRIFPSGGKQKQAHGLVSPFGMGS